MKSRSLSKMEKIMRMVDEDRLSSLPNELIHIIFSFLDMKEVLGTCLLSRRWRDLWKCVPVLNIDKIKWYYGVNFKRVKYNNFVDRLLLKNMSDIKRLCLNCGGYTDSRMVETWIYFAVRRHVQELCLDDFIPNWKTLNYIGRSIKSLQLVAVIVVGSSPTDELDLDFEAVEDLKMKNCGYDCFNHVNIYAPRLSKLVLTDDASALSKLRVTAPKLKQLDCKIKTKKDYSFVGLSSLVTAHIAAIIASWDNRTRESAVLTNCLKKVFRRVADARSLTLSACGFQILSEGPSILTPTSISFCDIRYLKLKDWDVSNHNKAIPRMIEAFPGIETLVSERHKIMLDPNSRIGWESDLSAMFMQCDFKSVEFQSDRGWRNEFKFLEFLLGEATMLKDITLTILQKEKENEKGRNLVMLPTTSSSKSILVKPTKSKVRH
ncbi:hypothetical protein ACHQM5_004952 [Ranunculus cassubicifolius]